MSPVVILIGVSIVLMLIIYAIRYVINNLVNKGTDAIGNAYRNSKNVNKGPEVVRLADVYPEIAAMHMRNGTAKEMNPALMKPAAAAVRSASAPTAAMAGENVPQANTAAQQQVSAAATQTNAGYTQQSTASAQQSYNSYGQQYYPTGSSSNSGAMGVIALIAIIVGFVINALGLVLISDSFFRMRRAYTGNLSYDQLLLAQTRVMRALLFMIIITTTALIVLLITKKVIYTYFFPILITILNILFYFTTFERTHNFMFKFFFRALKMRYFEGSMMQAFSVIMLVVLSIAFIVFYALYVLKGFKWSLFVLIGVGLLMSIFGMILLRKLIFLPRRLEFIYIDTLGFPIVCLLMAFAYKDRNKALHK